MGTSAFTSFFQAYRLADSFGKLIFLSLFLLSIITWIVLIQKLWALRQIRRQTVDFQETIQKQKDNLLHLHKSALPKAHFFDSPHPYARLFFTLKQKALELLDKNHKYGKQEEAETEQKPVFLSPADMEHMQMHMHIAMAGEVKNLEKNLFILSTVVSLAPFLGLLGTVWGILVSFAELQKGGFSQSNTLILGGLSTALTTTVLGLLIAIPALIAKDYLRNAIKNFFTDMDHFSASLLSTLELQYRKVDAT